jgi:tetratricopeptide (TPR) repeat protein
VRALPLLILAAIALPTAARADEADRELARQRYATGKLLFDRGRYADALVEFEAAKDALHKPEFDYNIGICLSHLDLPGKAAEALERFITALPNDPEAPKIRRMIAELRVKAAQKPAAPEPAPEPPTPPPPAPPPAGPSGRTVAAIALGAAGVVAIIAGSITGAMALSIRDQYHAGCLSGPCDQALYDRGFPLAVTTDVLIGVGAVAVVAAAVVFLTRPRTADAQASRTWMRW